MSRESKSAKQMAKVIRIWKYDQVLQAAPYLKSVLNSVRENHLEAQSQQIRAKKLEAQPGRTNRNQIIAIDEARRAEDRARDALAKAEDELAALDVFCLNPVRGEAVVPFLEEKQLAWYFFDLFDENPLRFWRYHRDDVDMRRPVTNTNSANDSAGTLQV
jgi:hypothetical protein